MLYPSKAHSWAYLKKKAKTCYNKNDYSGIYSPKNSPNYQLWR